MSKNAKLYERLIKESYKKINALESQLRALRSEPIAIIGMGCRFPGAESPEAFWTLLENGIDAIREVPPSRWDIERLYDPDADAPGKMVTRYGGFLDDLERFDADFFGISPREAVSLDPQQRLLLEVSWEALEYAALSPAQLYGSLTGVFIGMTGFDYARRLLDVREQIDAYAGTGSFLSPAAGRLSYLLGLTGPSMVVDTACSSSLVAIHLACQSLRLGESDIALAGGANLVLSPDWLISFTKARMLSPDGRCKTFDASANGYVRSEGCGVIVLKRLSDAQRAGDNILAVIRGSAVNQDGASGGLTVPSGPSQVAVIKQALRQGGIKPEEVSYIEAHGTGTSLGDPIEVDALEKFFAPHPLMIGSVKTNIGHLESAAGIAGIIKVVLSLQHGQLPAHLHLKQPNPQIAWENWAVRVPTELTPFPQNEQGKPIAGVSSFGFSGTNAHVVLQAAPPLVGATLAVAPTVHIQEQALLPLSAKTPKALIELAARYRDYLATTTEPYQDICFSAYTGRSHFGHRLAVVAQSNAEAEQKLSAFLAGEQAGGLFGPSPLTPLPIMGEGKEVRANQRRGKAKIAFLFTGQGSQYVGMGRELYERDATFRATLERCDEILRESPSFSSGQAHGQPRGLPLLEILYPEHVGATLAVAQLDQTAYTQPALFALEYALVQTLKSWGIEPNIVMGHSVGEYVAACVAGIFSLEDGLKLIAERGRLMQTSLPLLGGTEGGRGEMVAVSWDDKTVGATLAVAPETIVTNALQGIRDVSIAAINGPQAIVISGSAHGIRLAEARLMRTGAKTKRLTVSHAFHSPLMAPILPHFRNVLRQIKFAPPRIKMISNLTGEGRGEGATADYWLRHVMEPVRFADGMKATVEAGATIFIEIGPQPVLLGMASQLEIENSLWLPTLRPNSEWQQLLYSLGELYVQGFPGKAHTPAVSPYTPAGTASYKRVILPTYPWQRERYWVDVAPVGAALAAAPGSETTARVAPTLENDLYQISWQAAPLNETNRRTGTWLIATSEVGAGKQLADLLKLRGCQTYQLNPINPTRNAWQQALSELDSVPTDVIYLAGQVGATLAVAPQAVAPLTDDILRTTSISSTELLHLVQALVSAGLSCRLWIVTQGSITVGATLEGLLPLPLLGEGWGEGLVAPSAITQGALWGLGRTIALEHPELQPVLIDLDSSDERALEMLADDLLTLQERKESEIAYQQGTRYVARLKKATLSTGETLIKNNSSYLITGGLGALGLKVAMTLVEQGARHLILTGRSGVKHESQEQAIGQLEAAGAQVHVIQADISKYEEVERLLAKIGAESLAPSPLRPLAPSQKPPLRGIIHAAGVLDDGVLQQQTIERFEKVMAPKVAGAWNLHLLTQKMPEEGDRKGAPSRGDRKGAPSRGDRKGAPLLDFTIYFSSMAALLGSAGQSNYAAANAFMDTLAHHRRQAGLPTLSINWGPWAGEGMAAAVTERFAAQGLAPIEEEAGLELLAQLLHSDTLPAQLGVAPIDWQKFPTEGRALLSELFIRTSTEAGIRQKLLEASPSKRLPTLISYLQSEVAQVLRLETVTNKGFFDMGMDSLMAIELRNRLQSTLKLPLDATLLFQYATINDLADYLAAELWGESEEEQADAASITDDNQMQAQIEALSSEEMEDFMASRLAKLESLLGHG